MLGEAFGALCSKDEQILVYLGRLPSPALTNKYRVRYLEIERGVRFLLRGYDQYSGEVWRGATQHRQTERRSTSGAERRRTTER